VKIVSKVMLRTQTIKKHTFTYRITCLPVTVGEKDLKVRLYLHSF